jgi:hypothetical protein
MKEPRAPEILNLLELKPRRTADFETDAEGRVTVLVPKFKQGRLAKWLMPRLKKPHIRLRLDAFGSCAWRQFDGATSVAAVAERMQGELGAAPEGLTDRLGVFLHQLEREQLVDIGSAP